MGYIGIPDQGDHRWGGVDHFNGPVYICCSIGTGISKGVGDGVDSRNIGIHRAIGVGGTIAIHGIIPVCPGIDVYSACFVSNVTVSQ